MHPVIMKYNQAQAPAARKVCEVLAAEIDRGMPGAESKIWHGHPSGSWTGIRSSATACRRPGFD